MKTAHRRDGSVVIFGEASDDDELQPGARSPVLRVWCEDPFLESLPNHDHLRSMP
jgi:hypothetical protein